MEKALIICDSPKGTEFYTGFLSRGYCENVTVATGADTGRRYIMDNEYDVCIINAPLKTESGEQLSLEIAERNECQVILFVPSQNMDEVTAKVENMGVITVEKPINTTLFSSALKLAQVTQNRVRMVLEENKKLRKKMSEMKIVNHAKCVLVWALGMDETGAHKYIEKQAMDLRMTRVEVAKEVIERYEG